MSAEIPFFWVPTPGCSPEALPQVQAQVAALCAQEHSQALEVKAAQDARASEIAGAVAVNHGIS